MNLERLLPSRWTVPFLVSFLLLGGALARAQERAFDRRARMRLTEASPSGAQLRAIDDLKSRVGGSLLASFDESTGVTRTLMNPVGKLTPPAARGVPPQEVALGFVRENLELLGLEESDLKELSVCDSVYSSVSGATYVHLCQAFRGIPILNAQIQVNVSADGSVSGVVNSFVPQLENLTRTADASRVAEESKAVGIDERDAIAPSIDASDAVLAAGRHLGRSTRQRPSALAAPRGTRRALSLKAEEISRESIPAELLWVPVGRGLRLAWSLEVHSLDGGHVYAMTVDASRGSDPTDPTRVLTSFDLVSDAQYLVYPRPVESPNHTTPLPPADARVLLDDPADPGPSPNGWQSGQTLDGNNVHAYDDQNSDNLPPSSEPKCTASNCSFALDLGSDPSTYTTASIVNAFYWTNLVHDIQYRYGFDEVAGNFQVDNFGHGGLGNDALQAEIQDGSGSNNANMYTPADGSKPRMQMFLWNFTSPRRDAALDTSVVVHEYGHGISNRLVGGPSNVSCLFNNQQPGEGLSDWWALVYTAKPGDTGDMPRGIGTYVYGEPIDGTGIRTQPYSTDPTINTHTYESIAGMIIPHGVGEVWAQVAWEVYWALVNDHGFSPDLSNAMGDAGNQRMMLYVNEGLKATACSPTFVDVRDGILQAAGNLHGGEDICTIWTAFAEFGLGEDAVSGGPNSTTPTNGFLLPAVCDPGPRIISPVPGTTIVTPSLLWEWTPNGETVDDYELLIGSAKGDFDIYEGRNLGTVLSVTVNDIPLDGRTIYARLRYLIGGSWDSKDFTYKAAVSPPVITAPPPGSTLDAGDVTFEWDDNGTPSYDYWMYIGTVEGGKDLYDSGSLGPDARSHFVTGLPTDGSTIHVRLWWFVLTGGWKWADYIYTATDVPIPEIYNPPPNSPLPGTTVPFSWRSNGAAVDSWRLAVGSTPGGEEYFPGTPTTDLTATVSGLPQDGTPVYARLYYEIASVWSYRDFTYSAAIGTPEIFDPVPLSTLDGVTDTFQWRANGAPIVEWWLYLGSSLGARDIYDSGSLGLSTSVTRSALPTDGRNVYARLWYRPSGGTWASRDFTFKAATIVSTGTPEITSPPDGSLLPGTSATFSWTANGSSVSQWWIYIGTVEKGRNVYDSGSLGTATTVTVNNLPTDGKPLFLTLWYLIGGTWQSVGYEYQTRDLRPMFTDPTAGSTLTSTSVTLHWEAHPDGQPIAEYQVYVGTVVGSPNLFNSGSLGLATSVLVPALPTNGSVVYVRLYYRIGTKWLYSDVQFTTANLPDPTMSSPPPGTMLPGSSVTFSWAPFPDAEPVTEWWVYVGSTQGARNYKDTGSLGTSQSVLITNLPENGSAVWVRLWYKIFGRWEYSDFQYQAHLP